jgi:hypothetical protein
MAFAISDTHFLLGDKDNCGIGGIFSQKSCSERGQSSSRTKVVRDDDIT